MRTPPAHPCPACGKARYRFPSGDLAVLCSTCWNGLSDDARNAYTAAGRLYQKDRKGRLTQMCNALAALIQAAKDLKQQEDLFA